MSSNFLLDTHVFIWAMEENKRLSKSIKNALIDPKNKIFISVATVWEISIKQASKKIKLSFDIEASIKQTGFEIIPIQISHALRAGKLPLYHRDPFDRMIMAQAQVEKLTLITADPKMKKYKVKLFK